MKQLSFLFMAIVCTVFFSCKEDDDNQGHSITTFAGYGGAIAIADKGVAAAGETVTVTATPADGFLFKEWKVRVGNTRFENVQANPSTFTMPVEDVVIVATFMIKNDVLERITDPALKAYCQSRMDTEQEIDGVVYPKWDTNGNGVLSPDEAAAVKAIDATGGMNGTKIKSIAELVEFTGLEKLIVADNELTSFEITLPKLTELDCSYNTLTKLSVKGEEKLKELYCNNNHLSSLKLNNMLCEKDYNLHCGNQTTEEGDAQTLTAVFTEEQLAFWESDLKNLSENANVTTTTKPISDVYLTLTKSSVTRYGSMILLSLDDNSGNSIMMFITTSDLKPGEYGKEQIYYAYVTISGGGSNRHLDSDDPGSFSVKYNEASGKYTIEGVFNLSPSASYPSINVVGFEYVGAI